MTCVETFATLRIFSATLPPDVIGERLGIPATKMRGIDPASPYKAKRETNYWAWCSSEHLSSTDNLQHIRAILAVLDGKAANLESLRASGCEIDISNYWVSTGQGGPSLDAEIIDALSSLRLSIWWDVYFGEAGET